MREIGRSVKYASISQPQKWHNKGKVYANL